MVIVSPTTMSPVVKYISGCGPLSQVSQLSQPEITLPVTASLECRTVCPNVPSVATVPTIPFHHVSPQQPKNSLHHVRYLQAFDPCLLASSRGVPTTPTTPTTLCLHAPCAIPTGCTFPAPVGAPGSTQRNLTRPEQKFRVMQY
jgi:hypothetical protein